MIKLTSLQDEYAYLLTDDYKEMIFRIRALQEVGKPPSCNALVARSWESNMALLVPANQSASFQ